jgi:hypothetical protein
MVDLAHKIKEISWQEARASLIRDEPELVGIIDELSPGTAFNLIQVDYSFGDIIFNNKELHLPVKGSRDTFPLSHPSVPQKLKDYLGYSTLPLGFIANQNGVEIYLESKNNFHSIAFFTRGLHIGIWEFFEPPTSFTISAGARSMILLPKVADNRAHAALRYYNVTSPPPISPFDQWYIFREMANSPNFPTPWNCQVIYFPKIWIDKIKSDKQWISLRYYILQRAWEHTAYNRNRFLNDEMWESFFNILTARKIKPISYLKDFFRHLIHVALGSQSFAAQTMVAYKPTDGNTNTGPIDDFLKIYLESYNLQYIPTLMVPCHFLADNSTNPVYYSLQILTYWNSAPRSRDSISVKKDLDYLIWLYDTFKRELINGRIHTNIAGIDILFDHVDFAFFHSDVKTGRNERILPASLLPQYDPNFLYMPGNSQQYKQKKFADHCSFAHGCIKIALKD